MTAALAPLSFGPGGWGDELAFGAWLTIRLALTALPIGLLLGFATASMRNARGLAPRLLGEAYATVFRGLPELLTIFLVYFGAPRLATHLVALCEQALGLEPSGFTAQIDGFVAGTLALALVFGAFSSEVFLGAMRSVPSGQREAAAALGLSRAQSLRLVELPLIWRLALPGLGNNWAVLLKDTALVSVIAMPDLMRQANLAALATKQPFLFYLTTSLIYLALSVISTRATRRLEARAALPGEDLRR